MSKTQIYNWNELDNELVNSRLPAFILATSNYYNGIIQSSENRTNGKSIHGYIRVAAAGDYFLIGGKINRQLRNAQLRLYIAQTAFAGLTTFNVYADNGLDTRVGGVPSIFNNAARSITTVANHTPVVLTETLGNLIKGNFFYLATNCSVNNTYIQGWELLYDQ